VDGFVEISYSGGHLLLMECFDWPRIFVYYESDFL
jgi:hypothetical protein